MLKASILLYRIFKQKLTVSTHFPVLLSFFLGVNDYNQIAHANMKFKISFSKCTCLYNISSTLLKWMLINASLPISLQLYVRDIKIAYFQNYWDYYDQNNSKIAVLFSLLYSIMIKLLFLIPKGKFSSIYAKAS